MKDKKIKISEDQVFKDYEKGLRGDINLSKAVERHHDLAKASVKISLRIDYYLLQKMKEMAEADGLPYQTLIKILLRQAVEDREHRGVLERRLLKLEEKMDMLSK